MFHHLRFFISILLFLVVSNYASAADYYIHPQRGNDAQNGLSKAKAIKTLKKAGTLPLRAGDRLLLAAGQTYTGSLQLTGLKGSPDNPIIVETVVWDENSHNKPAIIDAKGYPQGLLVRDCSHLLINSLHIKANGHFQENDDITMRCGVLITVSSSGSTEDIILSKLHIQDIFYENEGFKRGVEEVRTANGSQSYGWGIRLLSAHKDSRIENIQIEQCHIENVGHTGIKITGIDQNIKQVKIIENQITRSGGPGIQMSNVKFVYVSLNKVSYSGSADDSRKWGRGSGLWTWSSSNVLIEKNQFLYANGPGDSAGAHIDYNCDNVILQYNLSAYNAGGFCEILGNNYNCSYRYNISVNDGHRTKGKNGAFQEGKIFWLSGYQGDKKERKGPVNSYFYNNTIYVSKDIDTKFAIDGRSDGILIANNIFYIEGDSRSVLGDQNKSDNPIDTGLERVLFSNNLFLKNTNWPSDLPIHDKSPIVGNPLFAKPGGINIADYIPNNSQLIKNKGIKISYLPNDPFGLLQDLHLSEDIMGTPVGDLPSIGAIE